MRDRPVVSTKTVNLDYLQQLQRGTLGREYVEWLTENSLTPDAREKVRPEEVALSAGPIHRLADAGVHYATLSTDPRSIPHIVLSSPDTAPRAQPKSRRA